MIYHKRRTLFKSDGSQVEQAEINGSWVDTPLTPEEVHQREHRFRQIVAAQMPPGSMGTDRAFLEGRGNGVQFEHRPEIGDHLKKVARRHGVDPKGKVYVGGLASFPGDPRAWVDGRGDVARVLDERGWGAEGTVKRTTRVEEPEHIALAEDIVDDIVDRELDKIPEADRPGVNLEDLREKVKERHTPHYSKKRHNRKPKVGKKGKKAIKSND